MGRFAPKRGANGTAIHVSDCRVWAEINYLDSLTDYREYLPGARSVERCGPNESAGDSRRRQAGVCFALFVICLFLLATGLMLQIFEHG